MNISNSELISPQINVIKHYMTIGLLVSLVPCISPLLQLMRLSQARQENVLQGKLDWPESKGVGSEAAQLLNGAAYILSSKSK